MATSSRWTGAASRASCNTAPHAAIRLAKGPDCSEQQGGRTERAVQQIGEDETADDIVQFGRPPFGLFNRGVDPLDQCGIVLGHLVHLADCRVDLGDRCRPPARGLSDFANHGAAFAGLGDHLLETIGSDANDAGAGGHFAGALLDQHLDLGGGLRDFS